MNTKCKARNEYNEYREQHKPAPGLYDGKPILSCVWCGRTLEANVEQSTSPDKKDTRR